MHMLSWLSTSGTAAIVEFPGVLYRGGAEKKIRKYYTVITVFLIIVIVALSLLLFHARQEVLVLIKEQYNEQQSLLAKQTAISIEENFDIVVRELELLTNMCAVKTFDLADIQDAMAQTYDHVKKHYINDIGFVDASGIFKAALYTPEFLEMDVGNSNYFMKAAALEEQTPVFEFIKLPRDDGDEKSIVASMPIFSDDGSFGGVILFVIKLHEMIEGHSPASKGNGRTWVVDEFSKIVYHPLYTTGTRIQDVSQISESFRNFISLLQTREEQQAEYFSPEGEEILAASYPAQIPDQKWYVVIATPESSISGKAHVKNSIS